MKTFLIALVLFLGVGLGASVFYNYQQWETNQKLDQAVTTLDSRVDFLDKEVTRHKIDSLRAIRDRDALMSNVREWEAWAESVKRESAALQTQLRELERQSATGGGGDLGELANLLKFVALLGGL